jgi:uncharacterized repeat protein (TIGR03806 family)
VRGGLFFLLSVLMVNACKPKNEAPNIVFEEEVLNRVDNGHLGHKNLSDYGFFTGFLVDLVPAKNVHPYELNTPLFSDYAQKKRFIYLPEGSIIEYHPTEVFDFPVGTVLIKNFYYDDAQLINQKGRIIETRLLIKKAREWQALPYIWNSEQTDAILEITGGAQEISLLGKKPIDYQIPNMGQCKSCHQRNGTLQPIGPTARQLNRNHLDDGGKSINQLRRLSRLGLLSVSEKEAFPKFSVWNDPKTGSLDERARAYLEMNCAHCHRKEGPAKNSGLYLMSTSNSQHALGIMKAPVAAGSGSGQLAYDIVPGQPEASILLHRMNSTEPAVMMPELGRKMIHKEGVALIRSWIASLE